MSPRIAWFPPRPTRDDLRLVAKMLLAGTLAWWVATLLGADRPIFAVLIPLVAMSSDPFAAINVSVTRTVGVFAGVLIGIAMLQLDLPSTAVVALLLAVALAAGLVLRTGRAPVNAEVAVTAMFMFYIGATADAGDVGIERIWETLLGAAIAVAVAALVWPADPLAETRRRVARLRSWLDADLGRAAALLARPDADGAETQLELVRERSLQAVRDVFEVERGERALRFSPLRRRDASAFAAERDRLRRAARQYRHLRALTRSVADIATSEVPLPPVEQERLATTMNRLTAAQADSLVLPPPVDPAGLTDPRAIGLAVDLGQMADDLARS